MDLRKCSNIIVVAGNRPEIIKLSEFVKSFSRLHDISFLYTGQHYSYNMRDAFISQLGVKIDYDLICNTSDIKSLTRKITDFFTKFRPEFVIVYGDTNSTLSAAIAAKTVKSKLIHLEAGLRSFDLDMAEERNRIKVDYLSDYLLSPTDLSSCFLRYEHVSGQIHTTGNLIVDVCRKYSKDALTTFKKFEKSLIVRKNYVLLTIHRSETVDNLTKLKYIVQELTNLKNYIVVFPIHPRTRNNLDRFKIKLPENVIAIEPQGYLEFLSLLYNSSIVLTDSGGVQEECLIMEKPCITLRNSTERQETLLLGVNRLYPLTEFRQQSLLTVIKEMLTVRTFINPYGENVTEKTISKIEEIVSNLI